MKSISTSTKLVFRLLNWSKFSGSNRLFVLSFENNIERTAQKKNNFLTAEIKDYNVMIDGQNFLDRPVKNNLKTIYDLW